MYADKKNRIAAEQREITALNLIQKQIQDKDLKVEDLNVLLGWHQVKVTGLSKVQELTKWKNIRDSGQEPPSYAKWSALDDAKLKEMEEAPIQLCDTALGRFQQRKRKEMEESFMSAPKEEQQEMLKKLKAMVEEYKSIFAS